MTSLSRLLADIGGTHARFAWQAAPGVALSHVQVLHCADHPGPAQAMRRWLQDQGLSTPTHAALAVACAVQYDRIAFTNNPWTFSIAQLQAEMDFARLRVINDFTALALALPHIAPEHLCQLGGTARTPFAQREPVALLGAGTGLGVSGLLPSAQGDWTPIAGEGGHVSLAVHDTLEQQVWAVLQQRHAHVSAETVLSGQGLVNLWASLLYLAQGAWPERYPTPAEITTQALQRQEPLSVQTLNLFCGWLGSVAGDLALTLGARGGVFLGGGIAPRLRTFLAASPFRQRFEAKGRYADYLKPLPVWLIDAPESPALLGVASLLD